MSSSGLSRPPQPNDRDPALLSRQLHSCGSGHSCAADARTMIHNQGGNCLVAWQFGLARLLISNNYSNLCCNQPACSRCTMAITKLVCVIVASSVILSVVAASDDHSSVQVLGSDFDEKVNDGSVYFIKFFAPWCGHCKRLAPTWKDLADAYKDNETIRIAHVDCTHDRDVCTTADIKGYPTLKVYHKGEEVKAYRGARELEALKSFVKETADELLTETTE